MSLLLSASFLTWYSNLRGHLSLHNDDLVETVTTLILTLGGHEFHQVAHVAYFANLCIGPLIVIW